MSWLGNGRGVLLTVCTGALLRHLMGMKKLLRPCKWLSLDNDVHNTHSGHSDLFPVCAHGELQGHDRSKTWLYSTIVGS